MTRAEIEKGVKEVLATFLSRGTKIENSQRILKDLKVIGDDTFDLAWELENRFAVDLGQSKWDKVYTVQDLIDVFADALGADDA